ncbi:hypothetical protein LBMAG42_28720 [Deltaproteobacteria bacterium]|nr:hypothetical protein LBMAG42_28720 [Deltaproteobacteria bacterium]
MGTSTATPALLALLALACDPASDSASNDADGDGYSSFAGDCDDADPTVHVGAVDAWYDGVDSDCDGNDDNDADADGSPVPDDCDDADAEANPGAIEAAGDARDADCDGDPDGAAFVRVAEATADTRGPRLSAHDDGTVGRMTVNDEPAADFTAWNPATGAIADGYTTFLGGYTFGEPLAFASGGLYDALAMVVYDQGSTYLSFLGLDPAGGDAWSWVGRGWPTDDLADFEGADVVVSGSEITVLGCASDPRLDGPILVLRGTQSEFLAHDYAYAWARSSEGADGCVLDDDDVLLIRDGETSRLRYDGTQTLAPGSAWRGEYLAIAAGDGLLVGARSDEVELREGVDDDPVVIPASAAPLWVRVARAPDDSARVAWGAGASVWLYNSATDEVQAFSAEEGVLDAAVVVSRDGVVVVAARTATAVWTRTVIGG